LLTIQHDLMIVARVIQGAGGAVFPLAFAIIRDELPRERVPHGIAKRLICRDHRDARDAKADEEADCERVG
jgi:hypothetical protein